MSSEQDLRALLIKAKSYKIISIIFALAGLGMFLFLYYSQVDSDITQAFHNPVLVATLVLPFLPAAVLSWIARRLEGKALRMIEARDAQAGS